MKWFTELAIREANPGAELPTWRWSALLWGRTQRSWRTDQKDAWGVPSTYGWAANASRYQTGQSTAWLHLSFCSICVDELSNFYSEILCIYLESRLYQVIVTMTEKSTASYFPTDKFRYIYTDLAQFLVQCKNVRMWKYCKFSCTITWSGDLPSWNDEEVVIFIKQFFYAHLNCSRLEKTNSASLHFRL